MTVCSRLSFVAALIAAVTVMVSAAPAGPAGSDQSGITTRTIYVNAFDSGGGRVDDLVAADFVVKEGGKARDVVTSRLARGLMQISLLVDDNGTGMFRAPIYRFVEHLQGHAEFAITTVIGQPMKLVDYTGDGRALSEAISGLSARPGSPDGGQLLQGIYEAARELEKREAPRPIIIALSIPGEEHSTLPAKHVLDKLKDSGASLHVFQVALSAARQMVAVTRPSALLEENLNLSEVLGDGSKQSGGRREDIVAAAGALLGLQALAEDLLHQYVIEYDLPPGVKPSERIAVSVTRKGVSLRAPVRIPARSPGRR